MCRVNANSFILSGYLASLELSRQFFFVILRYKHFWNFIGLCHNFVISLRTWQVFSYICYFLFQAPYLFIQATFPLLQIFSLRNNFDKYHMSKKSCQFLNREYSMKFGYYKDFFEILQHVYHKFSFKYINDTLTLVMMGGLQTLVLMAFDGSKCPPPFLFVKTIEKVIRLCTALKKKILDWQF